MTPNFCVIVVLQKIGGEGGLQLFVGLALIF